tara:strand:+ start:230 stop:430 length:201 start_codon:yes stop_codon:yes gene_type:complete
MQNDNFPEIGNLPKQKCPFGHSDTDWVDKETMEKLLKENRVEPNEYFLSCDVCEDFHSYTVTRNKE